MVLLLTLLAAPSLAGTGDPIDGTPSWAERDLHVWTNVARIAPHAFPKDADEGGCSPSEWATTPPTRPLRFHLDLARVARQHSQDLRSADQGLSHDSTDGTDMVERIQPVYGPGKAFGENLAYGYPTARSAVLQGWMCSDGHRKNLLDPRYDEVGHGVAGHYVTQDLGDGGGPPDRINAATHAPQDPITEAVITTDVWHPQGTAPDQVVAVVDGQEWPLNPLVGTEGQGIWQGAVDAGAGCVPWFVEARWADGTTRWPQDGSYAWGDCPWDDAGAGWLDLQLEPGDAPFDDIDERPADTDDTDSGVTDEEYDPFPFTNLCATSPTTASVGLVLLGILGLRRRRRRSELGG